MKASEAFGIIGVDEEKGVTHIDLYRLEESHLTIPHRANSEFTPTFEKYNWEDEKAYRMVTIIYGSGVVLKKTIFKEVPNGV